MQSAQKGRLARWRRRGLAGTATLLGGVLVILLVTRALAFRLDAGGPFQGALVGAVAGLIDLVAAFVFPEGSPVGGLLGCMLAVLAGFAHYVRAREGD